SRPSSQPAVSPNGSTAISAVTRMLFARTFADRDAAIGHLIRLPPRCNAPCRRHTGDLHEPNPMAAPRAVAVDDGKIAQPFVRCDQAVAAAVTRKHMAEHLGARMGL